MSEENDKPSLKSRLHIPAWLNIPFIIIIVGAVMILFVQQNNIFTIYENKRIIADLKAEIQANLDSAKYFMQKTRERNTNREELERIAREQYEMKRAGEDIFITPIP